MLFFHRHIFSTSEYFVCLLFLFSETLAAQNFNIQTFTTKDGLSHNDVRSVAVDSSGFLWIATWDGLSRYDGYSFKNYYHKTDDSLSLPYFSVYNVVVDGGNNLWLMTDDRLVVKYDRNNDIFKPVNQLYDSLPEFYTQISVDESGYLWLLNPERIFRFDFRKNEFDKFELIDRNGFPSKILTGDISTYSISTLENNMVWAISTKVFKFEKSSGNKLILREEYSLDNRTQIKNYDFDYSKWYRFFSSSSGNKWIFSNSGLFLLDPKTRVFREFKGKIPVNEFKGRYYFFWSWIDDGIYFYEPVEAKLSHIPHSYCQLVKKIMCQNKNLIWFSNNSMTGASLGLNRVIFTPEYFKNYPLVSEKNDVPAVYAIAKDRYNNIWVGIRGKDPLIKITPDMKSTNLKIPKYNTLEDPGALRSLNATPDGLWIGFFKELLLFYNFNSGKFTRYNPESYNLRPIALDKEGKLYLGGENNNTLIRFSPSSQKTAKRISYSPESPIYKILIDKKGIIWAGLNHSKLLRYDPHAEKSETISLSHDNYNIEDICQGDNEDLWLALLGGGVCNFDIGAGKKTFYTTSNGLANNMTYSILKDKSGNIWVSTNTGISRINPKTGIIRSFGLNEGLSIIEFNSGASFLGDDGEFFMGGMGGIVGFSPEFINGEEVETGNQRTIINDIKVSGENKHFKRSVNGADTIFFNKGENNFQVFFSSSDFINSDKTVYRYKLSGINEEWIETDSRNRNINYANLEPGWYNLKLQATDRVGAWSASKEVVIRIQPYYYQTLLFRISLPSILILLIVSMIYIYIRQLNQRAAQKQDALRLQSLQGQMNPHFIFNSLNSINYFISKNDALSANRYIADFSKLIRSILYNFNSDFIKLEKEIESLEEYLKIEHLRFGDKFNYKFVISPDIEPAQYKVSPGLVQPFIENAIWHGVRGLDKRKGNVEVSFTMDNGKLTCTIEDDGIGRKNAEAAKSRIDQKVSRGIFIVTERLKIINKLQKSNYQVNISDLYPEKSETGTKVVIDIPVNKN
jgi:ligand-binding sensor domain-containing protein